MSQFAPGPDYAPGPEVAAVRERLNHPVVDSDGHLLEYLPLVRDLLVEEAGESVARRFDRLTASGNAILALAPGDARRAAGLARGAFWGVPTANTLDRATAMLPALMHRRLPELGVDVAVLYPTFGLTVTGIADEELRRACARAFNRYYASAYAGYADRLLPVAVIPMHTPEEAVAELEYAVGELGLRAVTMAGVVKRHVPGDDPARPPRWVDTLAHDSPFDYDPVWAACERLGVAATFHASGMGWGSRTSTTNYVYNHIGNFAAAGEAVCRAVVLGGVASRFPGLRFAFQEGGVAWACQLYADLLGHHAKRNRDTIRHYDPAALDHGLLGELFDRFADGPIRERAGRLHEGLGMLSEPLDDALIDDFAESGISTPEDIRAMFTERFHFGCEADDPMNAMAFDHSRNPLGARLRGVFASDIGHWDVPDFRDVLPEAYELVEDGHLSAADFKDFVFGNPVSLWAGANPDFFRGTVVEDDVKRHLAG